MRRARRESRHHRARSSARAHGRADHDRRVSDARAANEPRSETRLATFIRHAAKEGARRKAPDRGGEEAQGRKGEAREG